MVVEVYSLDYIRVAISISALAYASYHDLKTREVSDSVWVASGGSAALINIYDVWMGRIDLIFLLAVMAFVSVFAFTVGYLGLFGEADLLAFVMLALSTPVVPSLGFNPLAMRPLIMPLSVISNSVLLGASMGLLLLIVNMVHGGGKLFEGYRNVGALRKIMLLISARRVKLDSLRGPPFEYPLEEIKTDGTVDLLIRPNISDDNKARSTISRLKERGHTHAWVSSTLPFLVMLLLGYVAAITLGDLVLWGVSRII